VLEEADDEGEEVEDGGDEEEGQGGPCNVDWHAVLLHLEGVGLVGLVGPLGGDAVDLDVVGVGVAVLFEVFRPPGEVGGQEDHRGVRREADQVEDPDPLGGGEAPAEAEAELAIADFVDDRVGGDAVLPLVPVVERGEVFAAVEYWVADAVSRLEAAV